jgi:hypothetical protein
VLWRGAGVDHHGDVGLPSGFLGQSDGVAALFDARAEGTIRAPLVDLAMRSCGSNS